MLLLKFLLTEILLLLIYLSLLPCSVRASTNLLCSPQSRASTLNCPPSLLLPPTNLTTCSSHSILSLHILFPCGFASIISLNLSSPSLLTKCLSFHQIHHRCQPQLFSDIQIPNLVLPSLSYYFSEVFHLYSCYSAFLFIPDGPCLCSIQ